jgi:signal transduction histidine kinase
MAEELQTQQEELQQTNEELEEKARQLTEQKTEVERKNREVELAKEELEEKAEQLASPAGTSRSSWPTCPTSCARRCNSLLILSRQLGDNREGNLSARQVEFSRTIHQSGADLLALINEILDLAKIESGTMSVDLGDVPFVELKDYVDRSFRQVATEKKVDFGTELVSGLPRHIRTDDMRLRQVLRNLLSNALKFTERGSVKLRIFVADRPDWSLENEVLNNAGTVIGFSVVDTGIGIAKEKQKIVFEAVPAGRRRHQPQVRAAPGWAWPSAGDRLAAGGRAAPGERAGQGQHLTLFLPAGVRRAPAQPAPDGRTAAGDANGRCCPIDRR